MSERPQKVLATLKRSRGVTLWRLNGIGTTLIGRFFDPELAPTYFCMVWFTVLFIPIWPIGTYLVRDATNEAGKPLSMSYVFLGRIDWADFGALYPDGPKKLVRNSFLHAAAFAVFVVLALFVIALIVSKIRGY